MCIGDLTVLTTARVVLPPGVFLGGLRSVLPGHDSSDREVRGARTARTLLFHHLHMVTLTHCHLAHVSHAHVRVTCRGRNPLRGDSGAILTALPFFPPRNGLEKLRDQRGVDRRARARRSGTRTRYLGGGVCATDRQIKFLHSRSKSWRLYDVRIGLLLISVLISVLTGIGTPRYWWVMRGFYWLGGPALPPQWRGSGSVSWSTVCLESASVADRVGLVHLSPQSRSRTNLNLFLP